MEKGLNSKGLIRKFCILIVHYYFSIFSAAQEFKTFVNFSSLSHHLSTLISPEISSYFSRN